MARGRDINGRVGGVVEIADPERPGADDGVLEPTQIGIDIPDSGEAAQQIAGATKQNESYPL